MDWLGLLKNFALIAAVFVPLKLLFALDHKQSFFREGWVTDILHFVLNAPIAAFLNMAILAGVVTLLSGLVPGGVTASVSAWPVWQQLIVIILIADLAYYWAHRTVHRNGFLWRLHAIHHSSRKLDVLATFRSHPIDLVLTRGVSIILPLALGFDTAAIVLYVGIFHWHGLFVHSNTRLRFGWLEYIIATPAWHRWHHADMGEASCNYAGQLAIYDLIFGSFRLERDHPERLGISDPVPASYPGQLIAPFLPSRAQPAQHTTASTPPPVSTPQGV